MDDEYYGIYIFMHLQKVFCFKWLRQDYKGKPPGHPVWKCKKPTKL